jgi:hypothetical protein
MNSQDQNRLDERAQSSIPRGSTTAENQDLRAEVKRLTTALQDIVALAHSAGDSRPRANLMLRRATSALWGTDRRSPSASTGSVITTDGR